MARKVLFTLVLGALIALAGAATALGAVTSAVDIANKLTVSTDAADPITVTCAGGNTQINGADPGTGPATCASITSIEVSGGTGGHAINLAGVTAAAFSALTSTALVGTVGADSITGSDVGDVIDGGAGGDTITGGPGNDLITAGLGNDNLVFGPAALGAETDTLVMPRADRGDQLSFGSLLAGDPVTVDLTGATSTLAIHTNRTVAMQAGGAPDSVTRVIGGLADDVMRAHGRGPTFDGGPGNDTLIGGAGPDTLRGGGGSDVLTGGPGDDAYPFDAAAAAETDTVVELPNEGEDSLSFSFFAVPPVDVSVDLSTQGLSFITHTNRTVQVGAAGQALNIEGVSTSSGNDTLIGNGAPNTLNGFGGNDRIEGRGGDDLLFPGEGDNTVIGGTGDDLYGFSFNLDGIPETQTVSEAAGGGRDTIQLLDSVDWTVNLASVDMTLATSSEGSVITEQEGQARHFEDVMTGRGNDALTGNNADNRLDAGEGDNTISGGRGDDTYQFLEAFTATVDVISELPGEGNDSLSFAGIDQGRFLAGFVGGSAAPVSVTVNLASAATAIGTHGQRVISVANAGQAVNLENVSGTSGDDQITGNDAANRLDGRAGNDLLLGGKGNDLLIDGLGNDALHGQQGDDVYRFSAATRGRTETDTLNETRRGGHDTLDFSALGQGRGVTVRLERSVKAIGGTVARELMVGEARMTRYLEDVIGGSGADVLSGNLADNTLIGGAGSDRLLGRQGADILLGAAGSDRLFGGRGTDVLGGGSGNDVLAGHAGNDRLAGGSGADRIRGHAGSDRVDGGNGADFLHGGAGSDVLRGGRGRDNFVARDGSRDGLNGGPGRDTARVDPGLDRLRSIERLR
ncbi:MAG: calcium-binding protein [Gaiellaceae bacterium]